MPSPNEMTDLELMQKPDEWVHSFVLPMKRNRGNGLEHGFLFQGSMQTPCPPPKPVVYLSNLFLGKKTEDIATQEYESLQAILDDGWRVD